MMIDTVDTALYRAKQNGKNQAFRYEDLKKA